MTEAIKNMILIEPSCWWDDGAWSGTGSFDSLTRTRWPIDVDATGADPYAFSNVLQSVIDSLPANRGASIRLTEGTKPYLLDTAVDFDVGPVEVWQDVGSVIKLSDTPNYGIGINMPVTWHGLNAQFDVANSTTSGRSLFKVRTKSTTVVANADVATAGVGKFIRPTGSWVTDGYVVGDTVKATGFAGAFNNYVYIVTAISQTTNPDDTLTVYDPSDTVTTESDGLINRINTFRDTRFIGGKVSVAQAHAAVQGFYVFDFEGSEGSFPCPGVELQDVTYEIRKWTLAGGSATQSTNSWVSAAEYTGVPYGIGFSRMVLLRNYLIQNCSYRMHSYGYEGDTVGGNYGGIYMLNDSCMEGLVVDARISGVQIHASTSHEALPFMVFRNGLGQEGGHTIVDRIYCENVVAKEFGYSTSPWVHWGTIQMGRWFPNKARTAFRLYGGRSNDIVDCSTHNFNGPSNGGTFSTSSVTSKATGTGIHTGITAEDWVELSGFAANVDGVYRVTAVATGELTLSPTPVTSTGGGDESVKQQYWVVDAQDHNDARWGGGNHAFRRSQAPLYRAKDCSGIVIDEKEPCDGVQTYT